MSSPLSFRRGAGGEVCNGVSFDGRIPLSGVAQFGLELQLQDGYICSIERRHSMISVKGTFQNGVAQPVEPIEGRDGQPVIITFLNENITSSSPSVDRGGWETMVKLVETCAVETGLADLAHQHDHYLYGKPKKA